MKATIHPKYKPLKINIGKDSFETYSTYNGNEYFMDVDFRKHPAWTRGNSKELTQSNKNMTEFNKKYGNLSFGVSTPKA